MLYTKALLESLSTVAPHSHSSARQRDAFQWHLFHVAKYNIAACVLILKNKRKQYLATNARSRQDLEEKSVRKRTQTALYQDHNDEKSAICIKALAGLEIGSHLLCQQAYHPVTTITSLNSVFRDSEIEIIKINRKL